ncbi:TRAP transporter small permease subunit [Spiribacter halobius]|uniref:TRAP transporter small permease protein n=1 Tax=Sediminicurvatus halobius TaxID=2182432 RepID=A0A2U2N6Y3_9GAMM|nr:TRAP transporter small permease subunit [Spiribacter halobius]PWG64880.1 C4-dicarboxylate ABC transporter permease [Spiribacter halobius]UEX78265.1 TRAP transporter small permease subunit [Spiribacter halobius]
MSRPIAHALRVTTRVLDGAGWLAKASAFALVLLVTANVLARYFFSEGLVGLQELEWHLVSPIALLGMSYALHQGEHVRVDVFYEHMRPRVQALVDAVTAVLTIAMALYLAWISMPYVAASYQMGQGSPDPGGLPYRFLLKAFIPLGFGLLALQGMAALLLALERLLPARAEAGNAAAAATPRHGKPA